MQRQARDKLGSARKTHPTKRGVLCCVQVRRICGFSVANLARRLCKVACGTLHPGSFARRCDIVYEFNKPFCFRAAVKQFLMQADHSPRQARGEAQRNILSIHTTDKRRGWLCCFVRCRSTSPSSLQRTTSSRTAPRPSATSRHACARKARRRGQCHTGVWAGMSRRRRLLARMSWQMGEGEHELADPRLPLRPRREMTTVRMMRVGERVTRT